MVVLVTGVNATSSRDQRGPCRNEPKPKDHFKSSDSSIGFEGIGRFFKGFQLPFEGEDVPKQYPILDTHLLIWALLHPLVSINRYFLQYPLIDTLPTVCPTEV